MYCEGSLVVGYAFDLKQSPMSGNNVLYDSKSEACTTHTSTSALVGPIKALGKAFEICGFNAFTLIYDGN